MPAPAIQSWTHEKIVNTLGTLDLNGSGWISDTELMCSYLGKPQNKRVQDVCEIFATSGDYQGAPVNGWKGLADYFGCMKSGLWRAGATTNARVQANGDNMVISDINAYIFIARRTINSNSKYDSSVGARRY